jgi:hypothetical protein
MKNTIAALLLTAMLGTSSCGKNECPTSTYEIPVGGVGHICQIGLSERASRLIYSGINSRETFSMTTINSEANFYHPIDAEEISHGGHHFKVEEVNPERIILTYLGKRGATGDF